MNIKKYCWVGSITCLLFFGSLSNSWTKEPSFQNKEKSMRVLHFVLRGVKLERAYWMINKARKAGFNAVQVLISDGVRFDQSPWKYREDAWTKDEFIAWAQYTRNEGIEVIPELKLLTHQEKFFQNNYPGLMFNLSTYDPRIDKTYKHVFEILDEIILAIHPKFFHIGHDEVAGHSVAASTSKWLRQGEEMLSAELFLYDVLRIHNYLKLKGIETWLWGDMLISPKEFKNMFVKHLHGSASGYGKALRDRLPRDIVVCDWHYLNENSKFPSLSTIQNEGFRVLGSTWKKEKTIRNFSRYASQHNAYGMIATTWHHVQRKQWDKVKQIIEFSGRAFSKDFSDAK